MISEGIGASKKRDEKNNKKEWGMGDYLSVRERKMINIIMSHENDVTGHQFPWAV